MKRALRCAPRGVVRLCVRDLAQARAVVKEYLGVAVAVLTQWVIFAGEGGARPVLRERGRGAARVRKFLEGRGRGSQRHACGSLRRDDVKASARDRRGDVRARLEDDARAVAAERRVEVEHFGWCVRDAADGFTLRADARDEQAERGRQEEGDRKSPCP